MVVGVGFARSAWLTMVWTLDDQLWNGEAVTFGLPPAWMDEAIRSITFAVQSNYLSCGQQKRAELPGFICCDAASL